MRIAITGSSGLIGTALAASLRRGGHEVVPVSRSGQADGAISWDPAAGTIDRDGFVGIEAVVHLAGEGIAAGPWTSAQRDRIHDSRSEGTALLATSLAAMDEPPTTLISGSAIGFYGERGDEVLTERSEPGDGFLADVCVDWEQAAAPAQQAGIRTVFIRTGIVLDPDGGALGKQLLPARLGLGAKAGRGTQWLSWITLADEVAAIRHCLETASVTGPVNLVAPNPVTNREFTKELGRTLHRPAFLTIPKFLTHLPFGIGDLLDSLLFTSARIQPTALLDSGFTFAHPDLPGGLASVLDRT